MKTSNRELKLALDFDTYLKLLKGSGIVVRTIYDEKHPEKVIACVSEYQIDMSLNKSAWKQLVRNCSI